MTQAVSDSGNLSMNQFERQLCEHCGAHLSQPEIGDRPEVQCAECGILQLLNPAAKRSDDEFFPLVKPNSGNDTGRRTWSIIDIPSTLARCVIIVPLVRRSLADDTPWSSQILLAIGALLLSQFPLSLPEWGLFNRKGEVRFGSIAGALDWFKLWLLASGLFAIGSAFYLGYLWRVLGPPLVDFDLVAMAIGWVLLLTACTMLARQSSHQTISK